MVTKAFGNKVLLTGFRIFAMVLVAVSTFGAWQTTPVLADKPVCAIPGKDGPATLGSVVVNTYYPGTADVSAGATSIPVGSPSGSGPAIQAGDLLLVIQMQGADIDSTNTGAYGDGVAGDPATGNLNNANFIAGQYEYVVATSAVTAGSVSISSGLVHSYSEQSYPVGAGNQGQRTYQVIRVPQYSSATVTGTLTAFPWNGSVGGVVAVDVAGGLTFNGGSGINVAGQGFRGGGGVILQGGAGVNTDYRTLASDPANASKGEGTAGTPRYIFNGTAVVDLTAEGYPNGSFARGAPGNAGGGATDGLTSLNEENSGGGGGGNGGTGGQGGFSWNSALDVGGFGGSAFSVSPARLVMGGGGGAGTINDNNPVLSSGGAGGGIVMIRAGTVTGGATINANGSDGQNQPLNDSGGGAGAGGTVLILAKNANLPAGLNVSANGGKGGDAWPGQGPETGYPQDRHGPGGGGGGGVIYLSSTAGTLTVAGGLNGITTTANDSYGSTPGSVGVINTGVVPSNTTTGISGAECVPTPSVVKTTSTPLVTQTASGTSGTYTIVASVPANQGTALGFTLSDTLPTGFTYNSTSTVNLSGGATRTSTVDPTTGTSTPAWGTFDIPGGGQVSITFTVDIAASVTPGTYQNPATATYTDPTRITPNGTTSTNYDPASSTGEDITVQAASGPALSIAKSVTETSYATVGTILHYSYLVTNTGNVTLNGPFSVSDDKSTDESCPATATLTVGNSITCTATYTVTQADLDAGKVTNIASAQGSYNGNPVTSPTDSKTVNAVQNPALTVVKSQTSTGPYNVNDTITYSIVVTNTGNITLTNVTVADNGTGATIGTCNPVQPATLAPTATMTCSATHVVTQTDLNNGSYSNTARADSDQTPPSDSTVVVNFTPTPALGVTKTETSTGPYGIGDTISYNIVVTNTGNVSLTGVTVTDSSATVGTCTPVQPATLAPTATMTCPATHVVTQADITAGSYTNIATADSDQTPPSNSSVTVNFNKPSGLAKSVTGTNQQFTTGTNVAIGEIVTYQVSVVVPQGVYSNVKLVDTMATGLAFVACDSITAPNLTTSIGGGFAGICSAPTVDDAGGGTPVDVDRRVTYNFGNLTNSSGSDQTVTITYRAVVLDSSGNKNGVQLNNSAQWLWSGGSLTPVSATTQIVEPNLAITKTSNTSFIATGTNATFTLTIQHTAASKADAFDVVLVDPLPSSLDYVTGTLDCTPGAQDPDPTPTGCYYDSATRTIHAEWADFTLAGGTGQIRFQVVGNATLTPNSPVTNVGTVEWTSLPGTVGTQSHTPNQYSTERFYDPNDPINIYSASASFVMNPLSGGGGGGGGTKGGGNNRGGGALIPVTGFAPGVQTDLSGLPKTSYDSSLGLMLEIPKLKLRIPIVGVPLQNGQWDVTWLTNQAGWLQETAFPGLSGNSVLTSHVTSAYGSDGPFAKLNTVSNGDKVFVHAFGQLYIYEIKSVHTTTPDDITIFQHEEKPWLTLVTCINYDEKAGAYQSRLVVRAVLVETMIDPTSSQ